MRKIFLLLAVMLACVGVDAQQITATWQFCNPDSPKDVKVEGDAALTALVTTDLTIGDKIAALGTMTGSNHDTGYEDVPYDPAFITLKPAANTSSRTSGHYVAVTITPAEGHSFKPLVFGFDGAKVGTDKGGFELFYTIGSGSEQTLGTATPLRNKVGSGNTDGYSHHEFSFSDIMVSGEPLTIYIYVVNVDASNNKTIALRNISIRGAMDEKVFTAGDLIKKINCNVSETAGQSKQVDLLPLVKDLKNGANTAYSTRLFGDPTDFEVEAVDGYTVESEYNGRTFSVNILQDNASVFTFSIRFIVTNITEKGEPKPLNRGLMAIHNTATENTSEYNLVSWRHREADGYGVKYKLWRRKAETNWVCLNGKRYIVDRTNFQDDSGTAEHMYKLEVYDKTGKLLTDTDTCTTWADQNFRIPLQRPEPRGGAFYCPNDASFCDMDGDGQYEIVLKWSPSNEKDAASSGSTSPIYLDCIKLDGTLLWRIDAGPNFFTSAHTMQFIAWDFDGDGFGELMMKTAPGTIDGEGNYVLLGDDDPTENLLSSRGKQDHGSEYISVFDGTTGAELATIPYHTDYAAGKSYWGDDKQNRSERYLAALAYLDGPDANPCPIFARGYYSGAFVAAYDWDGVTLKERWVSRNTTSGQGLWGEGAHWISVGDCDGDTKQEIVYGSAALDHDGSLLYRTGLGHGDALHLGDFLPDRPGMEVFMVHEHKPYGYDLRDAATGEFILRQTADSDTGRGLAAHFDSSKPYSQFIYSASAGMFDCIDGSMFAETWAIGSSGAGINNRIYWNGDLYDEFYDKSIIAHWNASQKWFDRYQVNGTNYTSGTLNNSSKYNPCVLGDILGDWREEIINWEGDKDTGAGDCNLVINATNYPTSYRLPHLMDDLNYRVQVVNQNCCYNQPPHLSFDPSVKYANNPNRAIEEDVEDDNSGIDEIETAQPQGPDMIYNLQGIRLDKVTTPGYYIINGKKVQVK